MNPENTSGDEPELDRLYDKAYELLGTRPHEAIAAADELLERSAKSGYVKGMALSRYAAGFSHFNLGDYSRAIEIYTEGDAMAAAPGLEQVAVKFRNGFGVVYFHLGRIEDSIDQYKRGLESARRLGVQRDLGNLLINLGIAYMKYGNLSQSLELLEEARILADSYKSDLFTIYVYFNFAEALQLAGKTEEAERAFSLCLGLARKTGKSLNEIESLVRLGTIKASRGEDIDGLAMIEDAIEIGEKSGYLRETIEAFLAAAEIRRKLGETDKALALASRAVDLAESHSIGSILPEALECRAAAENASDRHEKAYLSILNSLAARKTYMASEHNRLMAELETVYRMEALKNEAAQERRRREMLQSANDRLALVSRIGKSLAASLIPKEIMARLWEGLSTSVDMYSLGIGLLDPEMRMIEFSSWIEDGRHNDPCSISIDDEASFNARCVREACVIYFPSSEGWRAALHGRKPIRFGENTTAESILFLPLMRDDRVIGVLNLQSLKIDAYSPELIEMVTAISAFVSIAAENSIILSKLDTINRIVQGEKEAIEKVALQNSWQAEHDLLTGLPNRVLLDKILEGLSVSDATDDLIGIIYLDLDGFKEINDRFSHDAGDRALIQVTRRLKSVLSPDDHVARIGGDEFVIVIPGIQSRDDVPRILGKLTDSFVVPLHIDEGDMEIRFSAGVALYPTDGEEFKDLIRYADEAMYRVKRGSKNGWSFWSDPARVAQ